MLQPGGHHLAATVRRLSNERRAWNARTISATLAVLGVVTCFVLASIPESAELIGVIAAVTGGTTFQALAYFLVRKDRVTLGSLLMIAAALGEHMAIAAVSQPSALVIPYFVSVYIMVAATCLRRRWLVPVFVLAALTILAEGYLARLSGLDDATLRGPYIGAFVLMSVAAVVAWLHMTGLERAIDLAQQQEDERQRLFLELEKAARMEALGRLAGGIAHDFNNLLLVIQGSADLARDHAQDRPGVLEELRQIEEAAQRAAKLTSQLLAFSRRQVVPTEDVLLSQVLRDLLPLLERLLGSQMRLSLDVQDEEVRAVVSVSQLEQVIMNLVANARDASDKSGRVEIGMTTRTLSDGGVGDLPDGRYAELSVTDHGSGIPAEIMDHLFEPFFTTKGIAGGTGLGLATSFGIVRQMDGSIEVESEAGIGTTFRILIPVAKSSPPRTVADNWR